MSNSKTLAGDGDQKTPTAFPAETDHPIPGPDPLLGSGSFIENTTNPNPSTPQKNPKSPLVIARPAWLPEDWEMKLKTRTSGATEGTVDRYYIAPSGHRLRSKNEVLSFLETGSKSKRKKPTPNSEEVAPENSGTNSKNSGTNSKKKAGARKKVHAAFTFDFKNPPKKVSWCLTYASEDNWSPSIDDRNLPHSTKQEWAAVFNHICQN